MPRFPYQFFEQYIFRSSSFPIKSFLEKVNKDEFTDAELKEICSHPVYLEAVYLASPHLYEEIVKWVKGGEGMPVKKQKKLRQTILKYYNRISTRCTPFGLFSGVGLGNFDDEDIHHFDRKWIRDTKLDMHFLVALSQYLSQLPEIKKKLLYFPNTSIYTVGRRIRYVEYEYHEGKRQYIISSAHKSQELDEVLKATWNGKTIDEVINLLVHDDVTPEEATEFVDELIENQILVSQLEPHVSGDDFLDTIIALLKGMGEGARAGMLCSIQTMLEELDNHIGNPSHRYARIETLIKSFGIDYEQKFLFQTDLYFENRHQLLKRWKQDLKAAIAFSNKITLPDKETTLGRFKKAFSERFDSEEVPLAYAMDTEIGIGYRQRQTAMGLHPYLHDLTLPQTKERKDVEVRLNAVQVILNQKIQDCLHEGLYSIQLSDEDFKDFEENWADLPDTMSFMAELFSDGENEKLIFSHGGGSSAADLSARFCSKKSTIRNFTSAVADRERNMKPHAILAEIVHLPEARIGNVVRRPLLRDYEIPYLASSTLPKENQITVDDLCISLKNDKLILRSKRLNREVIPYLTNAHNYSSNSLPVYHFLSDLHSQNGRSSLGFNWGGLKKIYRFLPRVEYKNIILERARWEIGKEDVSSLLAIINDKELFLSAFKSWREKRRIPQWVQWVHGDNTLVLNLENHDYMTLFIDTVQAERQIVIEEFLHHEETDFAYQFVFSLHKTDK